MKLLFMIGNAVVGKMTVGQELAKITGLKLFHNHMTIEPVGLFIGSCIKRTDCDKDDNDEKKKD